MDGERLEPGLVVARRFRLKRKLGAGGFGTVWLASDEQRPGQRDVALKILHPQLRTKSWISERFEREIRVLSQLDHPSIAGAVAWSTEDDLAFLAMEFVEGASLYRVMVEVATRKKCFTAEDLRTIFGDLCAAVGYAHSKNVVHRDLKPHNVMIMHRDGLLGIKVLDFGIARLLIEPATDRTTVGRMIGSPYYLAPEQIDSSGVDERSDVFALGSILFELLTLKRAWLRDTDNRPISVTELTAARAQQNNRVMTLERITRGPRPRPSESRIGLSPLLDDVVLCALDVDPDLRFPNTAKLFSAFEEALARARIAAAAMRPSGEPVEPAVEARALDAPPPDELAIDKAGLTAVMPVSFDADAVDTEAPDTNPDAELPMPLVEPVPMDRPPGVTPVVPHPWKPPPAEETLPRKNRVRVRHEKLGRRRATIEIALALLSLLLAFAAWSLSGDDREPSAGDESTSLSVQAFPAVRARSSTAANPARVESAETKSERVEPRRVRTPPPVAPPSRDPAPAPHADLLEMLERARNNPEERRLVERVTDELTSAADKLPAAESAAIRRCIVQSNMAANLDQLIDVLTGCVRRLQRFAEQ